MNDIVKIKTNCHYGSQDGDVFLIVHSHELPSFEVFQLSDIAFNGTDFYNRIAGRIDYTEFLVMLQDPWGDFKSVSVIGNLFDNRDMVIRALKLNGTSDEYINKLPAVGGSK